MVICDVCREEGHVNVRITLSGIANLIEVGIDGKVKRERT